MKNVKMRIAIAVVICLMIFAIAPAFFVGALRTGSITMTVGDNANIELTNPILQMLAKYEVVDGNMVTAERGGRVEAYGPGETEVEIKVPFRTMKCKVYVLGFEEEETTMLTGQTCEPGIAGASSDAAFYSSNEDVVDIVDGKLVTLQDGDATIVCTDKGIEVSQTIHVAGIVADRPYVFTGSQMQLSTNSTISGTPTGWTSADASVATVDEKGVVTGVSSGSAVVSCLTGDNQTLETTVNVVGMKDSDLFLLAGEDYSSPLISGEGFDAVGIEWKSDDRQIVRVDESGNMKAVKSGETQVTCAIDGQTITGKIHVMSIPEKAFTAVGLDSTIQIAHAGDNSVEWKSSDETKVKVENGVLKGVGTGDATVSATVKGKTLSCNVSVGKMNESSLNMKEEDTRTLTLTGIEDEEVTWSSADESIAIVNEEGEITPVSEGQTMVYCSVGPSTMNIPVTVEKDDLEEEPQKTEEPAAAGGENTAEGSTVTGENGDTKGASGQEESSDKKASEKKEEDKKNSDQKDTSDKKSSEKKEASDKKNSDKKSSDKKSSDKKSSEKKSSSKKKEEEKPETSEVKNPEKVAGTGGQLTGPEAMIACGNYYNSVLENAAKNGEKWVYSNSSAYVAQSGTFEKMLSGKVRGGNCASIANWAFRDMGIISSSQKFYGDGSGKIRHYNSGSKKVKAALDKSCIIINGNRKSFGSLVKDGKVKVGDVIIGKGHTFVYRGNGTVFASGHDAKWHKDKSAKTEDSNKAVFESWVRKYKGTYDERFKVHYIIRMKDSFVPEYYRDENGNLVKNK